MVGEQTVCVGVPLRCMASAPILTIEELRSSIGVVHKTPLFQVDPADRRKFCESTYLNAAYPGLEKTDYEDGLVEGFYLVSLMDALRKCAYHDHDSYYGINYGSNRLRFIEKVFVSDVLMFECTVSNVKEKGDGFLVDTRCEIVIRGGTRPAVSYSMIYLLLPTRGNS